MQQFVDLCTSAGIDVARLELIDMFLIAGRIIQDFELFQRTIALSKSYSLLPSGLREQALANMTTAERAALRERVLGVVQLKKKA
jgi:hypothetical protein